MSFTNEQIIRRLQQEGAQKELIRTLRIIDQEIDSIFRAGGTSREIRGPQQRFDAFLTSRPAPSVTTKTRQ